ncbi:DsrE family protein [Methylovirgula sp. 4M-Z18]|uniref:DsrE family protein n=1 Tax=Methylovirgula sp. 4M-Z18 TaxID=2293567 RepID=UPI001314A5A3|nr:DsrE family protein [Methylovirgula sp. 4M-Z18]
MVHVRRRQALLVALGFGLAGKSALAQTASVPKVVYHLSDFGKVGFVLGNIRHHFEGMGGPEKVRIALVVHGPPLAQFRNLPENAQVATELQALTAQGLTPYACSHTMAAMKLTLADLMPSFAVAEKGGVVMLAELQQQGYAYLRP